MLDPSGQTPGRLFGERNARSYAACPGFGGREPSRFLGAKQLEKPETDSIIAERLSGWKGLAAPAPEVFGSVPQNPKRPQGLFIFQYNVQSWSKLRGSDRGHDIERGVGRGS